MTLPPLPELVQAHGVSTEAGLRVDRVEGSKLRIRGVALEGEGEVGLSFEDTYVAVSTPSGVPAQRVARLLERVMPDGYRVSVSPGPLDEAVLEIVRRPRQRPLPHRAEPRAAARAVDAIAG